MIRILSLGAGVQSTTVLMMAIDGELEPLDHAIFADTGEEPASVYRHLEWIADRCAGARLPLHIVRDPNTNGLLADLGDVLTGARRPGIAQPPLHVRGAKGRMQIRRQCTTHLKIKPIRRKIRELTQLTGRRSPDHPVVTQVFGISFDESHRMRDSGQSWIVNEYPLVDRRLDRHDCKLWMHRHGYPEPPRSACVMCPLRNNHDWRDLRDNDPDGWRRAIEFDELARNSGAAYGGKGIQGEVFVHFGAKPLADVDLTTPEDHGQGSLFGAECEGMCGI